MSFKVGDRVWLKNTDVTFRTIECVIEYMDNHSITVRPIGYNNLYCLYPTGRLYDYISGHRQGGGYSVEHVTAVAAAQQSLSDALGDSMVALIEQDFGIACDCGGFKTYESMADHYHSDWCKSRGK